ncbi:MAG: homocysteine biosynthesis protein [Bacillota bacterium]
MTSKKTIEEINEKIEKGEAQVLTAEEMIDFVEENDRQTALEEVDVVTTGTFGAMCSSGAFLNFGHSQPPIRMSRVKLNDVEAYAGLAAVDVFLGATQPSESQGLEYGGAHVIEDLLRGESILLEASSPGTDSYPRRQLKRKLTLADLNQAYLFNPRNCYQNYGAAVNASGETIYTYMGTLLPKFGNVTYSSAGQLSPLLNDPYYKTIGIGSRIFLGGAPGYIAWEGTQHNPVTPRNDRGVPEGGAGTIAVMGDLKQMSPDFIRAASIPGYGVSMYVGIGIPLPITDLEMVKYTSVRDSDIYTEVADYSAGTRDKPKYGRFNYQELRSGSITLENGKEVTTAPLSSYRKAREIADSLRQMILEDGFTLQPPIQRLPLDRKFKPMPSTQGGEQE